MQQSNDTPLDQQVDARPVRPPSYLVRAIILMIILVPLCLLVGLSSLSAFISYLSGPPFRSEVPSWMRALMELLKLFVAVTGLFMPLMALAKAIKVNSGFEVGDYGGAASASTAAEGYCRQSLIFIVLILLIMATDLFRYFASSRS